MGLNRLQQELCRKRLINTSNEVSQDWSEKEICDVLKSLKNGKCCDPLGLVNEIFKPPVAGDDLIKSITIMMNKIKNECKIPELFRIKNISTIYKNRGSKSDLENHRGIFLLSKIRTILMKLAFNSNYSIIDSGMTDANIGGRRNKREHI